MSSSNTGGSGWHGGGNSITNLFRGGDNASGCSITDSVVRASGKYGISIEEGSRLMACRGITFENNRAAPTYNSATDGPIQRC